MSNTIKMKKGNVGDIPLLAQAELGYCIDTDQVFIGDGAGNHELLVLGVPLTENSGILLDAVLSGDGKYSGVTESGTAGETLVFGDCCYLAPDGDWNLAKADVEATSAGKLGMCVLAAASDQSVTTMLVYGKIRAATLPALTVGGPVYISAAAAGDVVTTAPTGTEDFVVRTVGEAITAEDLFFNPDNTYVTLSDGVISHTWQTGCRLLYGDHVVGPVGFISGDTDESKCIYPCDIVKITMYCDVAGTGSSTIVDIKKGGATILSTLVTIEDGETSSLTAANEPVISDSALLLDNIITYHITQVGSTTTGSGLSVLMEVAT